MDELRDLVDQLRLYGVDVLWSAAIGTFGLWLDEYRILILGPWMSHGELRHLCQETLTDVQPSLSA